MENKFLIFKDNKISFKKTISLLILIMIFSGFFGFIYETIFYKIDLGYYIKRGSTFGPWIPIYAFGGLLITVISYRFRKNPLMVFVINSILTGLLEYGTGFVLYKFFGIRLWDYNTEIWNYGNINGYICLRSVLFFGISSLFLIYIIVPLLLKISTKISEKKLNIISYLLGITFLMDMILYTLLKRN